MKAKEFYSAGLYLRLSQDDSAMDVDSGRTESISIGSQRELLRSFVRSRRDMEIYDTYVDDGYSGINFDRPGFKRMMEDVRAGKVDCIIVKDLSRFGRDYIEAGRLIQKDLPALNVRFIAVTDHFDSLTADYHETSLVLPVKNFVNDSYCRDISGKVRSHQKVKREKGEFIGAFAVYGYCKDGKDKNRLVPDSYAAQIVKNIFDWKLDGMSCAAIAGKLNGLGILSPLEYKKSKGERFATGFPTKVKAGWSSQAVKRILSNEIYTGTMVQGRREKISYKLDKCREKPKEEWIRVEGTHVPVVAREAFDSVQKFLPIDSRTSGREGKPHLFCGLLFCGDCMEPMTRRVNRYKGAEKVSFICPTRNRGLGCTRHTIPEDELRRALLKGLQSQAALFLDESRVLSRIEGMEMDFGELSRYDQEIARLRGEEQKYLALRSGLYEDMKAGIITQEDFYSFRGIYEEQYARIQDAIGKQEEMVRALFKAGVASGIRLERFREALELTELNRDVLVAFVDRILVYEDKRICLELKNRELYSKVMMLAGYMEQREAEAARAGKPAHRGRTVPTAGGMGAGKAETGDVGKTGCRETTAVPAGDIRRGEMGAAGYAVNGREAV